MAEVRSSGPQICQWVIYQALNSFYPAIIVAVDSFTGRVRLTTFPAGGTTADQQSVPTLPRRISEHCIKTARCHDGRKF
jgi:hypothetical protein